MMIDALEKITKEEVPDKTFIFDERFSKGTFNLQHHRKYRE